MIPNQLLVFFGRSQSGKSTFANLFKQVLESDGQKVSFATKYTMRPPRQIEEDNIKNVGQLPVNCDVRGNLDKWGFGYDTEEIDTLLKSGSVIVVASDPEIVSQLNIKYNHHSYYYNPTSNERLSKAMFFEIVGKQRTFEESLELEKLRNPQLTDEQNFESAKARFNMPEPHYNKIMMTVNSPSHNNNYQAIKNPFTIPEALSIVERICEDKLHFNSNPKTNGQ